MAMLSAQLPTPQTYGFQERVLIPPTPAERVGEAETRRGTGMRMKQFLETQLKCWRLSA